MADSFELKKVYVPLHAPEKNANPGWLAIPVKIPGDSDKSWQEAEVLAKDGWELISVMTMTASWYENIGQRYLTFTSGYTLFFQRRIQK